jgi:hypothetical protein
LAPRELVANRHPPGRLELPAPQLTIASAEHQTWFGAGRTRRIAAHQPTLESAPCARVKPATGGAVLYPFERFTEKAKRVLQLTQAEAESSKHSYIGTEHLLVALLTVEDGLAARVLRELGLDLQQVRERIAGVLGRNEQVNLLQLIPTSRVKRVVEISFEQAREMGHNYVGTEHLLLGLLIEGEGIAAHVLQDLGAPLQKVRPLVYRHAAEVQPPLRFDDEVTALLRRAQEIALEAGSETIRLEHLRQVLS